MSTSLWGCRALCTWTLQKSWFLLGKRIAPWGGKGRERLGAPLQEGEEEQRRQRRNAHTREGKRAEMWTRERK